MTHGKVKRLLDRLELERETLNRRMDRERARREYRRIRERSRISYVT